MINIDKLTAIEKWEKNNNCRLRCSKCRTEMHAAVDDKGVCLVCLNGHIARDIPKEVFNDSNQKSVQNFNLETYSIFSSN
jgi:hypothetical protein